MHTMAKINDAMFPVDVNLTAMIRAAIKLNGDDITEDTVREQLDAVSQKLGKNMTTRENIERVLNGENITT